MRPPAALARPGAQAALAGLAFVLALLPFVPDYGISWDEPTHRHWAGLFEHWLTTGDWEPFRRLGLEGRYYGPLYDYLNYSVFRALRGKGVAVPAASHALNLVAAGAATALLFALARRLFGTRVALASLMFWALFPPLAAHAHYNPKDVVLAVPVLLLDLAALRAVTTRRARDWFAAGVVFALALAVKVSAVTAVPQLAAALLAARLAPGSAVDWRSLRREGRVAAVAGAVGILVGLFVFWPTMWAQPSLPLIGLYTRMAGTVGDGVSLYLGSYYRGSALPWHYVPVWMAVATPLLTLCCAALGSLQLVRELRGERRVGAALVLASFFVPMALACSPRLPRYDGMRHFFFCVPALAMLAGVGLVWLSARAAAAGVPRALRGGAVAALLAWLALEVARGHPYQGSYVNEPTRWLLGPHVERMLVMEYWGLTYREGFAWLNAHAARGARVCIPVAGHLAGSYATREDLRFECGEEVDYVMEMASHPRRQADTRGRAPSLTVSRYDSDLMYLYRVR